MENDIDIKKRILSTARDQFFSFGFTRVSIDEIASKLGMSKKTIYKYFPSKDELVKAVTEATLNEVETSCKAIIEDRNLDFVEKLQRMMTQAALHISKLSPPLIEDLQKNNPNVWREISEFRSKRIHEDFGKLLSEGIEKGIFRNDIDKHLVLIIYDSLIQNVISPDKLMQIPFTAYQVYETIVKVIFEGIMTNKSKLIK